MFHLWKPILEIIIIWLVVYRLLLFIQGTRTVQVIIGLLTLMIVAAVARFFELETINWVLTKFFAIGILAFFIIFQPEVRRGLARIGENAALRAFTRRGGLVDELVRACELMAHEKMGALIAIERDIGLRNYVESGVLVDARVSPELLMTVFSPKTPLHDGGVIVEGDRIASCGSLFPLSQNPNLSKNLGTRHRAALGLTEETDAVTIVVSEETGTISVAVNGQMTRNLSVDELRHVLQSVYKPDARQLALAELWKGFKLGKDETN